jgi:hypothetical protein
MRNVVLGLWLLGSCWMGGAASGCKDKDDPNETSGSPKAISSKDGTKFEHCGNVVCRSGRECCNESCGICTEPDVACTAQVCDTGAGAGVSALAPQCGGSAQRPCPGEGRCVDDGGEVCDPSRGAECGGTCACAKSASCPAGSRWNAAPQICGCEVDASGSSGAGGHAGRGEAGEGAEPPAAGGDAGEAGSAGEGGASGGGGPDAGGSGSGGNAGSGDNGGSGGEAGGAGDAGSGGSGGPVQCGDVTCASGQVCCNESCSICAPPGQACTTQSCMPPMGGSAAPPPCGSTTCAAGQVCCDSACGLCAASSTACKVMSCSDPGPHPGDLCDLRCGADERCEYVAATCIISPCLPIAQCVPFVACAGAANARCPGSGSCVDDTSDDCNPQVNRECAGKCVCSARTLPVCKLNFRWDFSPTVCACIPNPPIECIPELPCEA